MQPLPSVSSAPTRPSTLIDLEATGDGRTAVTGRFELREEEEVSADELAQLMSALATNIETVILGKRELIEMCVIGLMASGHILLEDVPGVGKTMLARAIARTLGTPYKRIQFTPDLLPSDVTGTTIFDPNERQFQFREGPVFSHVVLADEINRASPKTQSALLECMEEGQVTVDLSTRPLPDPFFVIATQNPIESEGVYPLPDSQLDRFALRLSVGYPHPEAEKLLMKEQRLEHPIEPLGSITDIAHVRRAQSAVRRVAIHDEIYDYILRLANATRSHAKLLVGLSPRGALTIARCAQARAALHGREFVLPDDVKFVAPAVMIHRLVPAPEARYGQSLDNLVTETLAATAVE